MGANAANKACQVAANLQDVLAIELLAACQALDFRGPELLSPSGYKMYKLVRQSVSFMDEDRAFHQDIRLLSQLLAEGKLNKILLGE